MRDVIKYLVKYPQLILLASSYYFFRIFRRFLREVNWVIGVDEIAKIIFSMKNLFANSYTVSLTKNPFYTLHYDCYNDFDNQVLSKIYRVIYGPIILGFLLNKSDKYIYIWKTGFLFDRESEFKFLKSKGKTIICLFVGSDIRSLVLRKALYKKLNIDGSANYLPSLNNEKEMKDVARIADQYADIIFNASFDQISYLKSKQYYPFHIYDIQNFFRNDAKFENLSSGSVKILHSPSNPIIKGTQIVRAAVKKLALEGYRFEYVELQNVDNSVVLENLKSSHIVLSEFYAFSMGMLSIESMANHCAVLSSSDPRLETGMPQEDNPSWLITPAWAVYDNLKYLLDNPEKIEYFADRGYEYAYRNFTFESVSQRINKILQENGIEI